METDSQIPYQATELWGGIECTINRVKDDFFDQLNYSKHYNRESDIELLGELGIQKIRYPILWENHQPSKDTVIDWAWIDRRLQLFNQKKIDVIAGLVHHGSGPAFTNLLDDDFPRLLAGYAGQVAQKFPGLEFYTPVNEPLTTARFSGLYGFWYPHCTSGRSFVKMLFNELKGTILAMKEIRKINPKAKLVQTEDLGKTYSTKTLKYQANFENERRWLTYDLLTGKVDKNHYLWNYFKRLRIPEKEVLFFKENQCIPDIFGFNHYVTSERFLDERLSLYPKHTHGGNGRHVYADVEVVRVEIAEETGAEQLLLEAWERYKKPMAITEVHLHSHREEQLRWFKHIWTAANKVKAKGVDIKAVTAWALFGSYGWNNLLTKPDGIYEPGVFDLRGGSPRPTALANYIKGLARSDKHQHPISEDPGWWQRSTRIIYSSRVLNMENINHRLSNKSPLVIIGKNGTLGRAFAKICHDRSIPFILMGRQECDITDTQKLQGVIHQYKPWAIINAAGFVRVDEAEFETERCFRENAEGVENLAQLCQQYSIKLLTFSSDLVFDGEKEGPYVESDKVNPLNIYGKSKAKGEEAALRINSNCLVVRTSAFFGPWDEYNFMHYVLENLSKQQQITVANDVFVSPTYVPDLVHATLDLLIDDEKGIWHVTNRGNISWSELAYKVANYANLDDMFINAVSSDELDQAALRPKNSVLTSEKTLLLPSMDDALIRFFDEKKIPIAAKSII